MVKVFYLSRMQQCSHNQANTQVECWIETTTREPHLSDVDAYAQLQSFVEAYKHKQIDELSHV